MSITCEVLGAPGRDNALLVQIDSGHALERLLFDCGEGCLSAVPFADVQAIDHLFFSHLHMDHVGGFDTFFRCNFGRNAKPNHIWGPPGTAAVMHHRFQGFLWNLHEQMAATWRVSDVHADRLRTCRYELAEAFATAHGEGDQTCERVIADGVGYTVEALTMDHKSPSLAYVVRERARKNVDTSRLAALGLRPGPWLKQLKDGATGSVVIDGVQRDLDELRRDLVIETPGEAVAYLTDFLLDERAMERLTEALRGCRTVVCEAQYRHADVELARKNHHMTTVLAATLASRAAVGELVLFHLSDRYLRAEWAEMLREAREVFANTRFPDGWGVTAGA